jgi:uncharacterized protein YdeI (YjbR/CyaY-like superfamily)
MQAGLPGLPRVDTDSRAAWRAWLERHNAPSGSIWPVTFKTGRGPHVPYDAIVEEALCFGRIDSRPARLDTDRRMLLLGPRRTGSNWSAANKARVERLLAAGLMRPAGLALVGQARADGSLTALDTVEALCEPTGLAAALDADPPARRGWNAFPPLCPPRNTGMDRRRQNPARPGPPHPRGRHQSRARGQGQLPRRAQRLGHGDRCIAGAAARLQLEATVRVAAGCLGDPHARGSGSDVRPVERGNGCSRGSTRSRIRLATGPPGPQNGMSSSRSAAKERFSPWGWRAGASPAPAPPERPPPP